MINLCSFDNNCIQTVFNNNTQIKNVDVDLSNIVLGIHVI